MASKFIWYELMTSDLAAAEAFYKAVVGWSTEPFPSSDFHYIIAKVGDTGVGGMMTLPAEAAAMGTPPMWMGYIYAADVDAATASIKAAGGRVYREPEDVPDVGRFSVVTDPQGATFMLLAPTGPGATSEPAPMTPGFVGWNELYADDWESALDFYSKQFGWAKDQAVDMGPMGIYQLFKSGGENAAGGMMNRPPQVPVPVWLFYFNVGDIDDAAGRIASNGGKVVNGPMQVPGGTWVLQAVDPQGAMFALIGTKS